MEPRGRRLEQVGTRKGKLRGPIQQNTGCPKAFGGIPGVGSYERINHNQGFESDTSSHREK